MDCENSLEDRLPVHELSDRNDVGSEHWYYLLEHRRHVRSNRKAMLASAYRVGSPEWYRLRFGYD